MPNVQQPEMRRSGNDPLVSDSVKDKAKRTGPPDSDKARGRTPQEQRSPYGPQDESKQGGREGQTGTPAS